jgi:hypothetical protein
LFDRKHLPIRDIEANVDVSVGALANQLSLQPFDRGDWAIASV